jgi:hypothetical protein
LLLLTPRPDDRGAVPTTALLFGAVITGKPIFIGHYTAD